MKLPKYMLLFSRRNWTLQHLYDRAGLSPKLQDLLAGQSGDYALPPNQIALITHTSLVSNYAEGAYYPKHHFRHLVDSIVDSITDRGGSVRLSTPVEHIEVCDGHVQSVIAGGETYQARETYISDMDPQLTMSLMHESAAELSERERRRITNYQYSISAFNIYLGVNERFDPTRYGLGAWNVWYYPQGNLNKSYQQQWEGNLDHPWVFLACPTLKSDAAGMAPPGHHVLEIATVCPYEPFRLLHETDIKAYRKKKRHAYEQVMTSVRDLIPDVDSYIDKKVYGTPTTSEHYLGQPKGNIYGANLVPEQVGLNRLGYHTELANLYLVGATAGYPSVPGVINNGIDVAHLITGESIH
jgi:all-trans-retinol 13,14-reductase